MGEGAISQSSPSKALKNVLPKSFSPFFLLLLHKFVRKFAATCPLPFLLLGYDCPSVLAIASVWLWWSSVGLVGLVALTSHARRAAQPRPQRRSRPVCASGFSNKSPDKTQQRTENLHLVLGSFFVVVVVVLECRGSQFATVFQQDFCTANELASYPVIVAFGLLPLQSTAFSQNSFPSSDF
ncbi:Hypothetical predicted protein [Xyrichtys novacula]|uniref:Uncharacterized protein n=1 Tax=Xyrichtys novacula TaxID=13765 RepID=A0AAV1ETF8_XYRNO|nr:Hypothetical predicted protein [Xyrichtys novacula]